MRDLLMFSSLSTLLVVTLAILIVLSEGLRRHRIGVTLLACWCSIGVSIYTLRLAGQGISPDVYFAWYGPLGTWFSAWAMWDVSRLARNYGTTTLVQAAEIARGFLLSGKTAEALWASWVYHLPTSAWLKAPGGVMVALNKHLEQRYGVAEKEYIGAADVEFFGPHASDYDVADRKVVETGKPVIAREPGPIWGDRDRTTVVLKFPVRDRQGRIVLVGGIELLIDDSCGMAKNCIAKGHGLEVHADGHP
jgi:hypothetical protein